MLADSSALASREYDLPFSTWSLSKLAEFLVAEGLVNDVRRRVAQTTVEPESRSSGPTSPTLMQTRELLDRHIEQCETYVGRAWARCTRACVSGC